MKPQSTKKLLAFIIIMMFSSAFVKAQYCKGDKVVMHLGGVKGCSAMCVPNSQVNKYLSKGWFYGTCPSIFPVAAKTKGTVPNQKIPNTPLVKTPTDNAVTSNKILKK